MLPWNRRSSRYPAPPLAQCLERIEPDRRKLVLLAFVDGYSHAELANRAAMPLGTVKSVIRRALAALRDCLSA
jgi:RNA polymerase sigma-70 factor (ECF subfamily)